MLRNPMISYRNSMKLFSNVIEIIEDQVNSGQMKFKIRKTVHGDDILLISKECPFLDFEPSMKNLTIYGRVFEDPWENTSPF